ncbi:glycoside hydrolase family 13 protein [Armillaria luteobubalina]|uniref:alpha-amylase n=1 Tax=Armillaria luteobubalina TaxID=153913 RepID=A0AA39Q963_9AGAR|nr:glycoside hydrolase family 13 protein [Armillaria luteobubalina]
MSRSLQAFIAFSFITVCLSASAEEWRSRSIYQLVTDRFAVSNDTGFGGYCDTSWRSYCGGSWLGITQHLDYIQDMGFDAIWISPIVENIGYRTLNGDAYHGFWMTNISSLNSHFGTADDLKDLASALHARGMYLMVDVVANHLATTPRPGTDGSSIDDFDFSSLWPFSSSSYFHPMCWLHWLQDPEYTGQWEIEHCWLGDRNVALVDLNTEDPKVVATMYEWITALVKDYSIDGLRIDTFKHIRQDFWPGFVKAAGVFSMGEVATRDVGYVAPYTHVVDSVLDYPAWFPLHYGFKSIQGNLSALVDVATAAQRSYNQSLFMTGSFLENHDVPRLQSGTGDLSLVKNAITWSFVTDGIPILYYGQEQGYQGSADPANREALWLSGYQTSDKPLMDHVKVLNSARKFAISSNSNFLTTPMSFIPQNTDKLIAISKPPLLTLLTNVGRTGSATWKIPGVFNASQELLDVLTCTRYAVDQDTSLTVSCSDGSPKVSVPMSLCCIFGLRGFRNNTDLDALGSREAFLSSS